MVLWFKMNPYNSHSISFSNNHRSFIIDLFKVLCIILIIITHDPFFVENDHMPIVTYLIDMAVPIFMFISGVNYASSSARRTLTLKQAYMPKRILRRFGRFLIPYMTTVCIMTVLLYVFKDVHYTLFSFLVVIIKADMDPVLIIHQ